MLRLALMGKSRKLKQSFSFVSGQVRSSSRRPEEERTRCPDEEHYSLSSSIIPSFSMMIMPCRSAVIPSFNR